MLTSAASEREEGTAPLLFCSFFKPFGFYMGRDFGKKGLKIDKKL